MSFDWGKYLELAYVLKALGDNGGLAEEAAYRACASKAYYSLFNQAKEQYVHIFKMDPSAHGRTTHQSLINAFHAKVDYLKPSSRGTAAKAVSQSLDRARDLRQCADYEDVLTSPPSRVASQAIRHVERGLKALSEIPSTP